jgi:NADH-quinone oxidoreductase subunit N
MSSFPTFPSINSAELALDMLKFLPETIICIGIVVLLLIRLFDKRAHVGGFALLVALGALFVSICELPQTLPLTRQWFGEAALQYMPLRPRPIFQNLLMFDSLTVYLRCILFGFTALVIWLSLTTGIPDREDSPDFFVLLLGAVLGMSIMASAIHLLMLYIGVEMASLPSYALAGYLKGKRQSSEAALKYVVYGGGASGVMLFGISLLAGKFGTGYLPALAFRLMETGPTTVAALAVDPVVILGALFLLIGVAFKLAAVPFHFWCPDVFEGAAAEVAGFLSVASKAAALAMLARVTYLLTGMDHSMPIPDALPAPDIVKAHWLSMARFLLPAVAFFAALTATFGNFAAYLQTNLKRLLAYSTIAHAGYMMMAVATFTSEGIGAMQFYLVAYLLMNLGAFAVVAYLRNITGSEDLTNFRGLVRRAPWMVLTLSVFLLSLLGVPPLIGFFAKFEVFIALYHGGQQYYQAGEPALGGTLYLLLVIGGINSVLSAVYYVKVMKVMILDRRAEDLENREPVRLREPIPAMIYAGVFAAAVFVLGLVWGPIDKLSNVSAEMQYHDRVGEYARRPPPAGGDEGVSAPPGGGRVPQQPGPPGGPGGPPRGPGGPGGPRQPPRSAPGGPSRPPASAPRP